MATISPVKDKVLRVPGQHLDTALRDLLDDRVMPYLLLPTLLGIWAGMEWLADLRALPRQPGLYFAAFLVAMAIAAVRVPVLILKARRIRMGRDGERYVAQVLERLRADDARIFHDVPTDRGNVDHIVVSPNGVYAIETKTVSLKDPRTQIRFDGARVTIGGAATIGEPVAQARACASWVAQLIHARTGQRVPVRAVVAFPGCRVEQTGQPKDSSAWVLEAGDVPRRIEQQAPTLTASEVLEISRTIARYVVGRSA